MSAQQPARQTLALVAVVSAIVAAIVIAVGVTLFTGSSHPPDGLAFSASADILRSAPRNELDTPDGRWKARSTDPAVATAPSATPTSAPASWPLTVPPTAATPSGTGFVLAVGDDVPGDLVAGAIDPADGVLLFVERGGAVLVDDMVVRSMQAGAEIAGVGGETATIPAGTVLCVWFLHAEASTGGSVTTEIDFGQSVLGLAVTSADLQATAPFGLPGVQYRYDGLGDTDRITIDEDGTALRLTLQQPQVGTRDQLRVFTSC